MHRGTLIREWCMCQVAFTQCILAQNPFFPIYRTSVQRRHFAKHNLTQYYISESPAIECFA